MNTASFPASISTPATSIDEVIQQLTAIVEWSKQNNFRVGYFAALYRKVTIQVKKGIADNFFDDGPRMEQLDIIFANRYLGSTEKTIINFSMEKARDAAWSFAEELSPLPEEQRQRAIIEKDAMMALFSNVISHPGFYGSLIIGIIRLGERGTTRQRIEILE